MALEENQPPKPTQPESMVVELKTACSCGSKQAREVHRISYASGTVSIMYECLGCGEYRL